MEVAYGKNRQLIMLSVLIAGILIPFSIGYHSYVIASYSEKRQLLREELVGDVPQEVRVFGNTYIVSDGTVMPMPGIVTEIIALRLARYAAVVELDPTFALPGVDLDSFVGVIADLSELQESFAKHYAGPDAVSIRSMYPLRFLRSLVEVEQLRRDFLNRPELSKALRYHAGLMELFRMYRSDIDRLKMTHRRYASDVRYEYPSGYNSQETIFAELERLRIASFSQERKAEYQFICFRAPNSSCGKVVEEEVEDSLEFDAVVPESVLRNERLVRAYRSSDPDVSRVFSRIVSIPDASCAPVGSANSFYLAWWKQMPAGGESFRIELLDDLYFREYAAFAAAPGSYDGDLRQIIDAGYQPVTTTYMCPDVGRDLSRVRAAIALSDSLSLDPVFADKASLGPTFGRLANLETSITSSGVLSYANTEAYMHAADELVGMLGAAELAATLGTSTAERLGNLSILFRFRSGYVDEIVGSVADYGQYALRIIETGYHPASPERLLVFHSNAGILLLSFNESITPGGARFSVPSLEELDLRSLNLTPIGDLFLGVAEDDIVLSMCRSRMALRAIVGINPGGQCVSETKED